MLNVNELHCRIRSWVMHCCVLKSDLLMCGSGEVDVCLL